MYPTISDLIKDLFGINILLPFKSYGVFLLLAFLFCYFISVYEMKRKEKQGLLKPITKKVQIGVVTTTLEYALSGVLGFIIGYKLIAVIIEYQAFVAQPKQILFTTDGSLWGGILGIVITVLFIWLSDIKENIPKPKWIIKKVRPYEHVKKILLIAFIFGLLGTKIFADLEKWELLIARPIQTVFSYNGISFLGGLLLGSVAVFVYAKRNFLTVIHLLDIAAIVIPITYAIGRIGCQISGDGCWGVYNEAYAVSGTIPERAYKLGHVASFRPPNWLSFIPDWFFAYDYPNNVLNKGVLISDCTSSHCCVLAAPVFPTPLYESILMFLVFGVLVYFRKKIKVPGILFTLFLIFTGLERIFIEKIRINNNYNILGFEFTQAEIISFFMVIGGVIAFAILKKYSKIKIAKYMVTNQN